jgi:hypothetical protein
VIGDDARIENNDDHRGSGDVDVIAGNDHQIKGRRHFGDPIRFQGIIQV